MRDARGRDRRVFAGCGMWCDFVLERWLFWWVIGAVGVVDKVGGGFGAVCLL